MVYGTCSCLPGGSWHTVFLMSQSVLALYPHSCLRSRQCQACTRITPLLPFSSVVIRLLRCMQTTACPMCLVFLLTLVFGAGRLQILQQPAYGKPFSDTWQRQCGTHTCAIVALMGSTHHKHSTCTHAAGAGTHRHRQSPCRGCTHSLGSCCCALRRLVAANAGNDFGAYAG